MDKLQLLWLLQQVDVELNRLYRQREQLSPDNVKKNAELERLQAEKAAMEEKIKKQQKYLRQREMDLQKITQEKTTLHQKLYGEATASGRELEQLAKKYRLVESEKDRLEEEIIEWMEEVEKTVKELALKEKEIKEKQKKGQQAERKRLKDVAHLEEKIEALNTKRHSLVKQISPELLGRYNELVGRFKGEGLALLRDGLCEGCGVFQPSSLIDRLNVPGALVYCESCGRLLLKIE